MKGQIEAPRIIITTSHGTWAFPAVYRERDRRVMRQMRGCHEEVRRDGHDRISGVRAGDNREEGA